MDEREPTAYRFTLYGVYEGVIRTKTEKVSLEHPDEKYSSVRGLHARNIEPLYEEGESDGEDESV